MDVQSTKNSNGKQISFKSTGGFRVTPNSLIKDSTKNSNHRGRKPHLNQSSVKKQIMMLRPTIIVQKIDGRSKTPLNIGGNPK